MEKKGPHERSRVFNPIKQCTKRFSTNNKKIREEGGGGPIAKCHEPVGSFPVLPTRVGSPKFLSYLCVQGIPAK
jgi:hypothetical protein